MPTPVRSFWIASACILGAIAGVTTLHVLSGDTLITPATPSIHADAASPPSEEAVLRAKMCNTVREAVREYATHVASPSVPSIDRDSAVYAVYMLCMMQAPR